MDPLFLEYTQTQKRTTEQFRLGGQSLMLLMKQRPCLKWPRQKIGKNFLRLAKPLVSQVKTLHTPTPKEILVGARG